MSKQTVSKASCDWAVRLARHWKMAVILTGMAVFITQGLSPSRASIIGSPHDFSGLSEDQQLCIYCHTPHNADTQVAEAPLWNHETTQKNYQVYNSPTMDATTNQPSASSRLCLSCHDGTIAVDSFGGRQGVIFLGGDLAVGADELSNDHPVSFTYDDALALDDGELRPPSSTPSGLGSTIADDMLFDYQMECSSCHDVHNGPAAEAVGDGLLLITQTRSQLCLSCHDK